MHIISLNAIILNIPPCLVKLPILIKRVDEVMDIVSKEKRHQIMSAVKNKNTKPELAVRSFLHRSGFRFRLHRGDLPGCPDIVLPKYRTVVFVHGCFWHRHPGCSRTTLPKTNTQFWERKFAENVDRDMVNREALSELGWKVIVIWECEVKDESYQSLLLHFLRNDG